MPGSDLSQPANVTMPSRRSACITVSTESAMTSRETSEKCIPSWPIEIPSETEMVPNCIGNPPASITPLRDALARRSSERLHGVISFHDEAIPICGFLKSSSFIPTARSMPRAGARSSPSVTKPERGFIGLIGFFSSDMITPVLDASTTNLSPSRHRLGHQSPS